jgi:hypothetical protein
MTVIRDKQSQPPAAIGQIVLWNPPRGGETRPEAWPAIIQFISDRARGIVDLTVFMNEGPQVKRDVQYAETPMPEHWTRILPERR